MAFKSSSPMNLGKRGEDKAAAFLKKKRYRIIQRGFRYAGGEIDIIAFQRGSLVFIEVKTRRNTEFGRPEEQVSIKKQKQIKKIAAGFLRQNEFPGLSCRFDVISLVPRDEKNWKIHHFRNAFE